MGDDTSVIKQRLERIRDWTEHDENPESGGPDSAGPAD